MISQIIGDSVSTHTLSTISLKKLVTNSPVCLTFKTPDLYIIDTDEEVIDEPWFEAI
jgi:hypothetical protein